MTNPPTVLIVEDSLTQRVQLERVLTRAGYRVVAARDGSEGLALLRTERPALVISDIQMPILTGYELCRQIKRQPAFQLTPVILLTSLAAPPDVVRGLACGADKFIVKPYGEAFLVRQVATLLQHLPHPAADPASSPVRVEFEGEEYDIRATPRQILNLLLPTYETALQNHRQLQRTHEELKSAQAALIQAEKLQSLGRLAAGVAHEVRNPLAIVEMGLGYLDSLRLPEEAREVLVQTREAILRANEVVTHLTDSSVPRRLGLQTAEIDDLLEQALELQADALRQAGVKVERAYGRRLPALLLDEEKMGQVFQNVIDNARRAMSAGGVLTVRTGRRAVTAEEVHFQPGDRSGSHFREGEEALVVELSDTGTGIAPEDLEKVFDPFFSTRPTGEATGLGLTVARKIVEVHGGTIEVYNRAQGGATVSIALRLP